MFLLDCYKNKNKTAVYSFFLIIIRSFFLPISEYKELYKLD